MFMVFHASLCNLEKDSNLLLNGDILGRKEEAFAIKSSNEMKEDMVSHAHCIEETNGMP